MGYMSRTMRVDVTMEFLSMLTDEPQSLGSLAERLGHSRDTLWHIFKRLKKANLIEVYVGSNGGIKKKHGIECDKLRVQEVFGYPILDRVKEVRCHVCRLVETRILKERKAGATSYVDEEGRRWVGMKCPDCVMMLNCKLVEEPLTSRKCSDCSKFLPRSRYFKCLECQPVLPLVDDEYIYHGTDTSFDPSDEEWGKCETD